MSDNVYLGNPNLKKANTPIQFSQENILEFVRCKEDPVYFARKYHEDKINFACSLFIKGIEDPLKEYMLNEYL